MKSFLKGFFFVAVIVVVVYIGYNLIFSEGGPLLFPDGTDPISAVYDPSDTQPVTDGRSGAEADTDAVTDPVTEKPAKPEYIQREYDFYYKQLGESEKVIYAGLYNAVSDGKNSIRIKGLSEDTYKEAVKRAVHSMIYDHPEFFWLNRGYTTTRSYADGKFTVLLELHSYEFYEYSSNPQRYVTELESRVAEVAALASGFDTDYEKAKFFFKYLADNTEYDDERLADSRKTVHSPLSQLIYTPYACLVEGKAVCAGYAKAYQMLCSACGIECLYITGWGGEERHGWNCVKLDGEYYFVDPTWGDGTHLYNGSPIPGTVNYEYLCSDRNTLELSHTLDETLFRMPDCYSMKYDYFVYNGYLLDAYSDGAASAVIAAQTGEQPIMLKFSSSAAYNAAVEDVKYGRISALSDLFIVFSKSAEKRIIYIFVL